VNTAFHRKKKENVLIFMSFISYHNYDYGDYNKACENLYRTRSFFIYTYILHTYFPCSIPSSNPQPEHTVSRKHKYTCHVFCNLLACTQKKHIIKAFELYTENFTFFYCYYCAFPKHFLLSLHSCNNSTVMK